MSYRKILKLPHYEKASSWLELIHCMKYFMGNLFFLSNTTQYSYSPWACLYRFFFNWSQFNAEVFVYIICCLFTLCRCSVANFCVQISFIWQPWICGKDKVWVNFSNWEMMISKLAAIQSKKFVDWLKVFFCIFSTKFSQLLFCTPFQYKDISSNW